MLSLDIVLEHMFEPWAWANGLSRASQHLAWSADRGRDGWRGRKRRIEMEEWRYGGKSGGVGRRKEREREREERKQDNDTFLIVGFVVQFTSVVVALALIIIIVVSAAVDVVHIVAASASVVDDADDGWLR